MRVVFNAFWGWYSRHYRLNTFITAALFGLQAFHLIWLTNDVVAHALLGAAPWFSGLGLLILTLVDYAEIPALVLANILYIHRFRLRRSIKDVVYLVFLNIQLVHIFWITDEIVAEIFDPGYQSLAWNPVLAWVAIGIDYLELPVMYETIREAFRMLFRRRQAEL